MKPSRECDLVDLLDKLSNKGLLLNADLIIHVAGVPLIGVNLKAAIAGIETMLDYGMMEACDQSIREWYAREHAKEAAPLVEREEEVGLRAFGSFLDDQWIHPTWRPGFFYLTNKRLFLFRKEPTPKVLLEISLDKIEGLMISKEIHYQKPREELYIRHDCGEITKIHTSNCARVKDEIERIVGRKLELDISGSYEGYPLDEGEKLIRVEKLWYLFPPEGIMGEVWKPGNLHLTSKRLFWTYWMNNQKTFELMLDQIEEIDLIRKKSNLTSTSKKEETFSVSHPKGIALFSGDEKKIFAMKSEIIKHAQIGIKGGA